MKILFVCTGNTCRSPMAEVMAAEVFKNEEYIFLSAGVGALNGQSASENAVLAAKALGLDLTNHCSKQITQEMIQDADLILTMTNNHKQALVSFDSQGSTPIFTLAEYAGEQAEIPDPYGCGLGTYEQCLQTIKEKLEKIHEILEG